MGRYAKLSNEEEFDERGNPRVPLYEDKDVDSFNIRWLDSIENDFLITIMRNHNAKMKTVIPTLESWGFKIRNEHPLVLPTGKEFWDIDQDIIAARYGLRYRFKVVVKTSWFTCVEDAHWNDIVVSNTKTWEKARENGQLPDAILIVSAFTSRVVVAARQFSHLWFKTDLMEDDGSGKRLLRAPRTALRNLHWLNQTTREDSVFVTPEKFLEIPKEKQHRHVIWP